MHTYLSEEADIFLVIHDFAYVNSCSSSGSNFLRNMLVDSESAKVITSMYVLTSCNTICVRGQLPVFAKKMTKWEQFRQIVSRWSLRSNNDSSVKFWDNNYFGQDCVKIMLHIQVVSKLNKCPKTFWQVAMMERFWWWLFGRDFLAIFYTLLFNTNLWRVNRDRTALSLNASSAKSSVE